jgi:hypothetical protein
LLHSIQFGPEGSRKFKKPELFIISGHEIDTFGLSMENAASEFP